MIRMMAYVDGGKKVRSTHWLSGETMELILPMMFDTASVWLHCVDKMVVKSLKQCRN